MLIPFNVDVPTERFPVTNWIVIGITILVSLLVMAQAPYLLPIEGPARYVILQRGDGFHLLQLVGHTLVHAGWFHLLGNMIFLFCFGNAVNAKFGHGRFLWFYVLAGALAGLAWLLLGSGEALIGASGAIMGVVGAFLVLYPRNDVSVFYWFFVLLGSFRCPSGMLIACYIAFDVWGLVGVSAEPVAYICHVVGMLVGIAVAVILLLTRRIESTQDEENLLELFNIQK